LRVRKIPGAEEALMLIDSIYIHEAEKNKGKWKAYFKNNNPIHAEFGGGKGKFIIEMAISNPHINFIMVDMVTEVMLKAAQKAQELELSNLKMIRIDLRYAKQFFDANELERIYLNFSDPWPKKKHYKRRLTYRDFLMTYRDILIPDGEIHFKTDNRGLFEFSLNEFAELDLVMKNISLDLHKNSDVPYCTTEYEEKFIALGQPIYRIEVKFRNEKKES